MGEPTAASTGEKISSSSGTVQCAHTMAKQCLALFKERNVDPTLLLILRHWKWLDSSRIGTKLKSFLELHTKICGLHVGNTKFLKEFEGCILDEMKTTGVVNLAPTMRVEAYRKAELFEKYNSVKDRWPQPHMPYLIQMRPGPYILLANWQAGFHLLRSMAASNMYKRQDGKHIPVELLYEGQMAGEPCRCILDCEAYMSHYEGHLSRDELIECVRQVPQALTKALVRIGAIKHEDVVMAFEKNKCRGEKISFHFTLNILIDPTVDGKRVLEEVIIAPYRGERARCRKDGGSASCMAKRMASEKNSDGTYNHALFHVDEATIKGKHQFSVVFSRKTNEEPCRVDWVHRISEGGTKAMRRKSQFYGIPMVPTHTRALDMLCLAGFSHWIPNTLVLHPKFRVVASPVLDLEGTSSGAWTVSIYSSFLMFQHPAVRL
jgi:hypothetical protein